PGETVEQVDVPVVDDAVHEDTEGFALSLSSPLGATPATAQGQATIVDDDAAFAPAAPAAPQIITVVRQPAATAQALTSPAVLRTAYAGLLGRGAVVLRLSCPAGP